MARIKKVLLNLVLLLFALIIALLVGEGLVRIFAAQDALIVRAYTEPHAELGSVSKPNFDYYDTKSQESYGFSYHVRTNSLALRMNDEVDISKPCVLYMGDSFTFGWGVEIEESYFSILSKTAVPEGQKEKIQALNCGRGGYSTGHVARWLEELGQQVNVSQVIYFMNWNDLYDNIKTDINYRNYSYTVDGVGRVTLKKELVYTDNKRYLLMNTPYSWLNIHSHLFVLVKSMLKSSIQAKGKPKEGEEIIATLESETSEIEKNDMEVIEVTLAHIMNLANICNKINAQLLIVWISPPAHLTLRGVSGGRADFEYELWKDMLLAQLESLNQGIEFFDPTDKLNQILDGKDYAKSDIYFGDGHYTKLGNVMFAVACKTKVREFVYSN